MIAQEFKQAYANGERNFKYADLSHTDLSFFILTGANLDAANLYDAIFTNVKGYNE